MYPSGARCSQNGAANHMCNAQAETPERRSEGARPPPQCGSMVLLYDETDELELRRAARDEQLTDVRAHKRFASLGFY